MPELPEVETTKEGIKPHLKGQIIRGITVRNPKLRQTVPNNMDALCAGKTIHQISRRAKYLLLHLSTGYILIHLGMSGHLRMISADTMPAKHDHVDLILTNGMALRFCDPRRFGLFLYLEDNPQQHPLLIHLGPEPLAEEFDANYLFSRINNRTTSIKSLLMNNHIVVGIGNIYATEALFYSGIHPSSSAQKLSQANCEILIKHIKRILKQSIELGGTTLRDFYNTEGKPGYFSQSLQVYGRATQNCYQCDQLIQSVFIAGRNSAFCPNCQALLANTEILKK